MVATLGLLLCCGLISCSPPTTPARKVLTRYRLKNAYYTMQVLEKDNRQSIVEQLQNVTNKSTLQDKWVELMVRTAVQSGIQPKTALEQLCHDGYGNLFNVDFRANLVTHMASPSLTNLTFPVVVWSSGPNGSNELGFGDDIVAPSSGPVAASSLRR